MLLHTTLNSSQIYTGIYLLITMTIKQLGHVLPGNKSIVQQSMSGYLEIRTFGTLITSTKVFSLIIICKSL